MRLLLILSFLATVSAVNLYAASYSGDITSLSLSPVSDDDGYKLLVTSVVNSLSPNPSWLHRMHDVIFIANENLNAPNGSLTSYRTSETGQLSLVQQPLITPPGPVSISDYNDGKALAVAHYSGSTVSTFTIDNNGILSPLQSFTFNTPPGPHPQQDVSHPHQAIVDPSGQFIVVPDLGSDLIRIFSIDESSLLKEQKSYSVPPGSGPRHGAFIQVEDDDNHKTFFFLISELANTVSSYAVSHENESLNFKPIFTGNVMNSTSPPGLASAEITLSPDERFLLTSARNNTVFSIPDPASDNDRSIPSDSLQIWNIDSQSGVLEFEQLAPAGGRTPRHFSLNNDGTMVAVALQGDGRVMVYERNVDDGKISDLIAWADVKGEVTNIIWDD